MTQSNLRGLLLALLIGAAMAAGVILTAPQAKADTTQDYYYFALLQESGLIISSPKAMKQNAAIICNELDAGTNWRLIITRLMAEADYPFDTATTVMAAAVVVYCPQHAPNERQIA